MLNLYGQCFKCLGQLGEPFIVYRRSAAADQNGRVPLHPVFAKFHCFGEVTPMTQLPVDREASYQLTRESIEVNTDFALQGPGESPNNLGDQVWWRNQSYLVIQIRRYERYGVGFVTAICELETQMPSPEFAEFERASHSLAEEDAPQPVEPTGV